MRKRRHAALAASAQHDNTYDPIESESNQMETYSTSKDHYEKYDVEAIEIDTGLSGEDTDEDEYYGDQNKEEEENEYRNPKDFSTARWTLFKGIEMLIQTFVKHSLKV